MRLPVGAKELIAMRLAGKRPAGHIVVTDAPVVSRLNRMAGVFALFVDSPGAWDMRCVHGLPVIVWCFGEDQLGIVESVAQADPAELGVMSWQSVTKFPAELAVAA